MLTTSKPKKQQIKQLSWKDSVAVQKVLNALCQILAEEYCHIAKENPEIFTTRE